jgi:hypothetical protein
VLAEEVVVRWRKGVRRDAEQEQLWSRNALAGTQAFVAAQLTGTRAIRDASSSSGGQAAEKVVGTGAQLTALTTLQETPCAPSWQQSRSPSPNGKLSRATLLGRFQALISRPQARLRLARGLCGPTSRFYTDDEASLRTCWIAYPSNQLSRLCSTAEVSRMQLSAIVAPQGTTSDGTRRGRGESMTPWISNRCRSREPTNLPCYYAAGNAIQRVSSCKNQRPTPQRTTCIMPNSPASLPIGSCRT